MSHIEDLTGLLTPSLTDLLYIYQNGTDFKITNQQMLELIKTNTVIPITQAAYDLLPSADKNNGAIYIITDAVISASDIAYGTGTVKDALDKMPLFSGAGYHNCIYRGKYLGSSVTAEQYNSIDASTFDDLFIGDYWTIGGVNYRIAAFDYYYGFGVPTTTTHHIVIVPDTILDTQKMNDTDTTQTGYALSKLRTSYMTATKNIIKNAFGASHILTYKNAFVNAVDTTSGIASGVAYYDADIEIMNERNVYGNPVFSIVPSGSVRPANNLIDFSQYPLFAFNQSLMVNGDKYWLRDNVNAMAFCAIWSDGTSNFSGASSSFGIRPSFLIYKGT